MTGRAVTAQRRSGAAMPRDTIAKALDAAGITEYDSDTTTPGEVISAPSGWRFGDRTCTYMRTMIAGWAADTPAARHPWVLSQHVRLECARRLGCITEADYRAALRTLETRLAELCASGDVRRVGQHEIRDIQLEAVKIAAAKTDSEAREEELGNHKHASDTPEVVAERATAAVATAQQATGDDSLLTGMRDGSWLDAQNFPPLEYAVPGLVPEGCGLLVGPPKVGKSWLVGNLGLSVAAGGLALGSIPVHKRPVLYMALEDGHRRLQSRFRHITGGKAIPPNIHVVIKAEPAVAIPMIIEFLLAHAGERPLVILDTLGKVRPPKRAGDDGYQLDYAIGGRLKAAVDSVPGASLLIVHHTRKAESADFVDSVSGTQGIAGAVDFVLVLKRKRQSDDGVLQVTGRDIPEAEYALKAADGMLWQLDGSDLATAARVAENRTEAAALGALSDRTLDALAFVDSRAETRANEVAEKLGIHPKRAAEILSRLADSARIRKVRRGVYGPFHVPTGAESADSADLAGQTLFSNPHPVHVSADSAESDPDHKSALSALGADAVDPSADLKTTSHQANPHYPHNPHNPLYRDGYPSCRVCGHSVTTGVGDVHLGCRQENR